MLVQVVIFTYICSVGMASTGRDYAERKERTKRDTIAVVLTESMKDFILHTHNQQRQNVHPSASNMALMEWNDELAGIADTKAATCDTSLSPPPDTYYTLTTALRSHGDSADTLDMVLKNSLSNTAMFYDQDNNSCSNDDCMTYLVTIWHDVNSVGCGMFSCDSLSGSDLTDAYILICLYRPRPDFLALDNSYNRPYKEGYPCTDCPSEYPACHANYSLCLSQSPVSLELLTQPGPQFNPAGIPFEIQPKLALHDDLGNLFKGLAYPGCPWYVAVVLSSASDHRAELIGKCEVPVVDGYAEFTDLGIDTPGNYVFSFFVSFPHVEPTDVEFTALSGQITMSPPPDTLGNCHVEEGDPRFERDYEWGEECSGVCIADCAGQHSACTDLNSCGPHAECADSECVCSESRDFSYDVFDETHLAETVRPEVNCMPGYIEIRLNKCGMNAMGYKLADLYLCGPNHNGHTIDHEKNIDDQISPFIQSCEYNDCRGFVSADENGLAYSFIIQGSFTDCNGGVEVNDTHITYKHAVRGFGGFRNSIISRQRPIEIKFCCSYMRSLWTTVELFVNPFIRTVKLKIASRGVFDVSFGLWTDSNYFTPITEPPMITIPDVIFVGLFVRNVDVVLFAEDCWATLTDDPEDPESESIIDGGRPADETVGIADNGEKREVLFSFESFAFPGHADNTSLYLHCKVHVCVHDMAPCTTSFLTKRRRSPVEESDSVSTTISLGPITVQTSTRKKRSILNERYASSFASEFATQELSNPPFARTTGLGAATISYE